MKPSVFTLIIRGELPSYKIYEDKNTIAFLNIHPSQPGHVLVVPKLQIANLYDLPEADYNNLMQAVKTVMVKLAKEFGDEYKICLKVMGFDVPHVHVHVLPCRTPADFAAAEDQDSQVNNIELSKMAQRLKIN